jgi:Sec-independent protein translocase protein TatA
VGLGTELLFVVALALVVLGPKRLHAVLGGVARAKAEFEEVSRGFKSHLGAEFDASHLEAKSETSHELVGDQ